MLLFDCFFILYHIKSNFVDYSDIYTHVMHEEEKRAIEKLENDIESLETAPPEYITLTSKKITQ